MVSKAKIDGVIGPKTLEKLEKISDELFLSNFSLMKIARYVHLCKKRPENRKFFYGWINRTMEGL